MLGSALLHRFQKFSVPIMKTFINSYIELIITSKFTIKKNCTGLKMKSEKINKIILIKLTILLVFAIAFNSSYSNYSIYTNENLENSDKIDFESNSISTSSTYSIFWEANGTIICNAADTQRSIDVCSDGAKGAIIAWTDNRSIITDNFDVYAQRVNSNGDPLWTKNGTLICNATNNQWYATLCIDGMGGAIITWTDYRNGNADIYAQRIDKKGEILWDNNGTVICNATGNQNIPLICYDGDNGAIISWQDTTKGAGDPDIYAQKINSNGKTLWDDNGTVICNNTESQGEFEMCYDENGGAIITWKDTRAGGGKADIYAQKINSTGKTLWDDNGTIICNTDSYESRPDLCNDGQGGAIIVWDVNQDVYAQRINSTGTTLWDDNGTVICNESSSQYFARGIVSNGSGGAIVAWDDMRDSLITGEDVYAQKVDTNGNTYWGNGSMWGINPDRNGTVISNALGTQASMGSLFICSDMMGGAFIAWTDTRNGNYDIYAQRINRNGIIRGDNNGTVVCNTPDVQSLHDICSDGAYGSILVWQDQRDDAKGDVYAQRIGYPISSIISNGGDGDDDDDDDDEAAIPGYNLLFLFGTICLISVIFVIKRNKKNIK